MRFERTNTVIITAMQWLDRIKQMKIALVVAALLIAVCSLVVSHFLIKDLEREEYKRMEIWAEAMQSFNRADETTDLGLVLKVMNGNNTIPVIVLDSAGQVEMFRNVYNCKGKTLADSLAYMSREAKNWKNAGNFVRISTSGSAENVENETDYLDICYNTSSMLQRLAVYPFIQLGIVLIFVVVVIFALLSFKRAEQNKVWVGLSKETAHQLGTPISSLMAWLEIMKENYPDDALIPEMGNDVKRLQLVAERFSKIGSVPEKTQQDLIALLNRVAAYMSRRASNRIRVERKFPCESLMLLLNASLFEWVMENLSKNAFDAMSGSGTLTYEVLYDNEKVMIDVSDTGKGIARKNFASVFTPGFTTKSRGWGLGLTLAKRIVEEYHNGKIYVLTSELGKGTTFRIELKR